MRLIVAAASPLEQWFLSDYCRARLLEPATVESYLGTIHRFDCYCGSTLGRSAQLAEIREELLAGYVHWLLAAGLARATVRKHRRQLLALVRVLHKRQAAPPVDVAEIPLPAEDDLLRRAWTPEQIAQLCQAAPAVEGRFAHRTQRYVGPHRFSDWIQALILCTWSCSWRIGAVMRIESANVFLDARRVIGYERKVRQQRIAELVPEAVAAISRIHNPTRPLLFGDWPHDFAGNWKTLDERLGRLIAAAGVPDHGRWHCIRRTSVTAIAALHGLKAASQHAGHASERMTLRHYIDPLQLPQVSSPLPPLPPIAGLSR